METIPFLPPGPVVKKGFKWHGNAGVAYNTTRKTRYKKVVVNKTLKPSLPPSASLPDPLPEPLHLSPTQIPPRSRHFRKTQVATPPNTRM